MERRRSPPTPPPDEGPARKRPAFDPGLLSSPFYRGPTGYGGAGARGSPEPRSRLPSLYERRRVDVRPVAHHDSDSGIGQTAKRIRELLAHCSTPIEDAKRATASPSRSYTPPSLIPRSSNASSVSSASSEAPRRLRELRLPAMATLLRLKRNNRTVGSAQAAIAASLSSSLPYRPEDYATRNDSEAHKNKLRAKINGRNKNRDEETMPTRVALPDAKLDFAGKEMPKIVFDPPPVKRFTFRNPLDADGPETERLQFIDMRGAAAERSVGANAPEDGHPANGPLGGPAAKFPASTAPQKPAVDPGFASIMKKQKSQWECDSCLSRNDDGAAACACCEAPRPGRSAPPAERAPAAIPPKPTPPAPTTNGPSLAGLVQKQKAQWECDCCLARNDPDRKKCVCCEAPKPGATADRVEKFNFGSSSGGFKFGIQPAASPPKADVAAPTTAVAEKKDPAPVAGFVFGASTPAPKDDAKAPVLSFGIPNGAVSTGTAKVEAPAPRVLSFGVKKEESKSAPSEPFAFGTKPSSEVSEAKSAEKSESIEANKTPVSFGFLQSPNSSKEEVKHIDSSKTGEIKSTTPSIASVQIPETKAPASSAPTSVAEKPSLFSFGSTATKAPFGFSTPPSFNFSAAKTETPKTSFGSSEVFSFSAPPNEVKNKPDSVPKFSSPLSNLISPKIAFSSPSTNVTSSITIPGQDSAASKDSPANKLSGVQFQLPTTEKNEQSAPAPVFSFTASASPVSMPSASNAFKSNNTAAPPVFTFGTAPVSKPPETTSSPFSNQIMTPSNIFSNQPASEINKTPISDTLFKTNTTPVTSSFGSITSNIFGSKPSSVNPPQTANLFGNNQPSENRPAGTIFGSGLLNNTSAPQLPQTNSIFSNPSSQPAPFSSGSIFGSPSLSNSTNNPPQTNLFGSPPMNKPAASTESGTGLFGKIQNAQSGGFFGTNPPPTGGTPSLPSGGIFGSHPAVPTPVFGASIPFGDASQTQPAQNVPFKFGASNPTQPPVAGFGQAPPPGSSAPVFSFGSSAAPAPMNSQFNFSMGAPTPSFPSTPGANAGMPPRRFKRAVRRNVPR